MIKTVDRRTATLKFFIAKAGITQSQMARHLEITDVTLSMKVHNPDTFKVSEVNKIIDLLELTHEEAASVFFS